MNRKRTSIAIDRENIKWKQNRSSGGTSVVQKVPECPTHDGRCETPPSSPPHGSATPPKGRAANGQAFSGPSTSKRSVHPILDPHEIKDCRHEHLAVIQAEASKLARLAEARSNLNRQIEFRRFLGKDQALSEGPQRLEQAVRTREQLAAELAARRRLAARGKLSESLYDMTAIALNVTSDGRSAALGRSVELLDALTRVAEETLQSPDYYRKCGVGPCDRGTSASSSSAQGGSNAPATGCQPEHVGVLPAAPLSVGGVYTLQVTTADPAAVKPSDRRAATATVQDPWHVHRGVALKARSGKGTRATPWVTVQAHERSATVRMATSRTTRSCVMRAAPSSPRRSK